MEKNKIRKTSGFSLIELLIYTALMSVLLVLLTRIFSAVIDSQLESESTSVVLQDGSYILNRLMYDIGRAQSITMPASAGLTTTCAGGATCLQLTINGVTYAYAVGNNNKLQVTTNGTTDDLNSLYSSISNVQFKRLGVGNNNDSIQISYRITSLVQKTSGVEYKDYQVATAPHY